MAVAVPTNGPDKDSRNETNLKLTNYGNLSTPTTLSNESQGRKSGPDYQLITNWNRRNVVKNK